MQIQFDDSYKYDLVTTPYNYQMRFQCIINKGEHTYDDIIADTASSEQITVYDDEGAVAGIYNGFTKRIAVSITQENEINLEFENTDTIGLVNQLSQDVASVNESVSALNDKVDELTPYTETKTAYYGETEKTFYNVPEGNVSVFFDNYNGNYSTSRTEDRLTVSFDALEYETNITISIQ